MNSLQVLVLCFLACFFEEGEVLQLLSGRLEILTVQVSQLGKDVVLVDLECGATVVLERPLVIKRRTVALDPLHLIVVANFDELVYLQQLSVVVDGVSRMTEFLDSLINIAAITVEQIEV